ncbi:helix-turn-helix transcriptional regulator [Romboutsia lituseburensis]|uniref:helix-turn-helix transcriptional regulator n=1 Tax=Romboutsia lituseburensis TaxID=1537 RepID=UPI00215B2F9F|nr:transcriptional regulator [Romboutsia lituseburensis]MCR8743764.1 transcriptional regulator [Romboutsia lituseburensis]
MIDISSIQNIIKMIILLQSRGKMKGFELAQELEVSERRILKYKKDLEAAGIWIESKPGAYGGYSIISNNLLGANIKEKDIIVLEMLKEQLLYNNDINKNEFIEIVDKLKSVVNSKNNLNNYMDYFTVQSKCNYDYKKQKELCDSIIYSYITKRKIQIDYYSLSSGLKNRVVHPYGMFTYKGDTYMVAYCESRKRFLDFKICRIESYEVLEEKYKFNDDFNWDEYSKNCVGIYKDGEIDLVLKINKPFSLIIEEKIWVDNQEIIQKEKYIIFKARMNGYSEIKSWVLSMGSNATVLEPQKLKEDIKEEIKKIKNLY